MAAKNRYMEDKERIPLQKRFAALYVNELTSQRKAARLVGISKNTACKWVKEMNLKAKREVAMNKATNGRDRDSANYLYAKLRIMNVPYYQEFVRDFKQIFNSY